MYAIHRSFVYTIMYSTSLFCLFGVSDLGKQSSSISACNTSSNDFPGSFFVFSLLEWRLMSITDAFLLALVFVLCRVWISWWRCTYAAAMDVEWCLDIMVGVSPGYDIKWYFFITFMTVDRTDEKHTTWIYWANSMCFFICYHRHRWIVVLYSYRTVYICIYVFLCVIKLSNMLSSTNSLNLRSSLLIFFKAWYMVFYLLYHLLLLRYIILDVYF